MIIHDIPQRSDEWYSLRAGMATASDFSKIVTSTGAESKSRHGYALTLAAEKYAGKRVDAWEGNEHTERGKVLEDDAVAWYEFEHDCPVVKVGFVTDDEKTMGCSPDGAVGDNGLIEIKCLKAERHIEAILYYQKNGTCPPDYVQQTQGQMMITGRTWCDLLFFHPDLPSLVIRQTLIWDVVDGLLSGIPLVNEERDKIVEVLRGV